MYQDTETTESFSGERGLTIFYRKIVAENEKARLVIAHGLGEHSGRYANIFDRLIPTGISIWALDFCGHGQSQGQRGHIDLFDQYILDLKKLAVLSQETKPAKMKTFLLGHSMGGLIALNFAQRFPELIDGVIASSPALGMKVVVPKAKAILGKIMSTVWPSLSMGNELDASKISHDEQVVKAYIDDPLVHDRVTARWFTEYLTAMDTTRQSVANIRIPTLMQIAGDDHLVDATTSKTFFDELSAEDKTIHFYDHLYHEIYNETVEERKVVLSDLTNWIESRMPDI